MSTLQSLWLPSYHRDCAGCSGSRYTDGPTDRWFCMADSLPRLITFTHIHRLV